MNLFDLMAKITFDSSQYDKGVDSAKSKASELASKIGSGLKAAAKIGTAAISAVAAGITALTKASIENYAEYEQLVGGVETLFKNSANIVQQYAANAYKTAGLSANEYMETVTGFSASLLQSLEGDTEAAARAADQAIIDMSDNANKMGTAMESIQNAYAGFAKGNYTMLDNLKLGYGGTKEEMARLLNDAADLNEDFRKELDKNGDSFANVVEAIHIVQSEMGITGTTAKEAASTISGSTAAMKSAWSNLVTGIADDNAQFDVLVNNFVDSVGTVAENILPRVETALDGVANLVDKLVPVIVDKVPSLIESVLPKIANSAVNIVDTFLEGLRTNSGKISKTVIDVAMTLITGLGDLIPEMIQTGAWLLESLMEGIASNTPKIVAGITKMFDDLIGVLTDLVPELLIVGADMLLTLAQGLSDSLPDMIPKLVEVITWIAQWLVDPYVIGQIVDAGIAIMLGLTEGIVRSIPVLLKNIPAIIKNLVTSLIQNVPKLISAAKEMVGMFVDGIKEAWFKKKEEASASFTGFIDKVRAFFTQKIPEIINNIGRWFSELPDKIAYWLGFAIGKIAEWGQNAVEWVETEVPKIIENVVTFFAELPDKIKAWLNEVITKIKDWVTETINTIVQKVPEIIDKIVEFFEELPEKIKEIGTNIVNGLYEGIKNAWDSFTEKITGMFDNFVQGLKDGLNISVDAKTNNSNVDVRRRTVPDGKHRTGLDYVPFDGYIAELHKGEKVLTAQEAKGYTGNTIPVTNNFYGGYTERDGAKIARSINRQLGLLV